MARKFTTPVELPTDPAAALQAATKQYVDAGDAARQPLDSDLTDIAGLTVVNDSVMQGKAGAWAVRTPAQLKTDLILVKGDVGLGSVDNTTDTAKPVSTAQQTALDLKAPLASPTFTGAVTTPRLIRPPVTITYAATVTIDASTGDAFAITATGPLALNAPTNPTNGQPLVVEVLASGANRIVTVHSAIVPAVGLTAAFTVVSGKVGFFGLRYSTLAGNWVMLAQSQET